VSYESGLQETHQTSRRELMGVELPRKRRRSVRRFQALPDDDDSEVEGIDTSRKFNGEGTDLNGERLHL
jgi:hypothetical protein